MRDPDRTVAAPSRLLALLALCATACLGRSEASVRNEFDAYVAGANSCTATSDCVIAYPGCPLGCVVAVRADRKADVEAKAADLISQYRAGGSGCVYDCIGPVDPVCTNGKCAFVDQGSIGGAPGDTDAGSD
jgi:hypothetical protein